MLLKLHALLGLHASLVASAVYGLHGQLSTVVRADLLLLVRDHYVC